LLDDANFAEHIARRHGEIGRWHRVAPKDEVVATRADEAVHHDEASASQVRADFSRPQCRRVACPNFDDGTRSNRRPHASAACDESHGLARAQRLDNSPRCDVAHSHAATGTTNTRRRQRGARHRSLVAARGEEFIAIRVVVSAVVSKLVRIRNRRMSAHSIRRLAAAVAFVAAFVAGGRSFAQTAPASTPQVCSVDVHPSLPSHGTEIRLRPDAYALRASQDVRVTETADGWRLNVSSPEAGHIAYEVIDRQSGESVVRESALAQCRPMSPSEADEFRREGRQSNAERDAQNELYLRGHRWLLAGAFLASGSFLAGGVVMFVTPFSTSAGLAPLAVEAAVFGAGIVAGGVMMLVGYRMEQQSERGRGAVSALRSTVVGVAPAPGGGWFAQATIRF
jgi:hypothetical protein